MGSFPLLALGSWAFSFGPFAQHPWDFERVCRFTAAAGYDGIEINGFRPHPHHRDFEAPQTTQALAVLMRELGLGPVAYAPDFRFAPPAEVAARVYLDEIEAARSFCERLGIRLLRVDTVSPPGPLEPDDYARRFDTLVTTWRAAADRCAGSGITIVWE